MFIGEYRHTLDEKGRFALPARFRDSLQVGVVITRGLDHCLFLYPKPEWEIIAAKVAALPLGQADTRAFARLVLAGAITADIDRSGRVLIPEYLRTYACLGKSIVLAGLYTRLEIWAEASWQSYSQDTEAKGNAIAERLVNLSI